MDLFTFLKDNSKCRPDHRLFAVKRQGEWQFKDLRTFHADVENATRWLTISSGLPPGATVGIAGPASYEWIVWDLALMRGGFVVHGCFHLVSPSDLADSAAEQKLAAVFCADPNQRAHLTDHRRIKAFPMDLIPRRIMGSLPEPPPADAPALQVMTSGTTGAAKVFSYTHRQLIEAIKAIDQHIGNDRVGLRKTICWLPLAFMTGRMLNYVSLFWGTQIYIVADPRTIMGELKAIQPDYLLAVPRFYEKIHEALRQSPAMIRALLKVPLARSAVGRILRRKIFGKRLRVALSGSSALRPEVAEFFAALGLPILEAYAMSECATPIALSTPSHHRTGSVGKPLSGQALVLDRNKQLLLRHSGLHHDAEYLNGFFCTGDIGELDEDGFLYIRGRIKDLIKTSTGHRISPLEVEGAFGSHPLVERLLVIGNGRGSLSAITFLTPDGLAQFRANPDFVTAAVAAWINEKNPLLPAHKQLRRHLIADRCLSPELGDYTTNLKLRRGQVEAEFKSQIDELYELPIGNSSLFDMR